MTTGVRIAVLLAGVAMVGGTGAVAIAKPGDLDPAFGDGGRVLVPLPTHFVGVRAVAEQPDDRLIVVGQAEAFPFAARFLPDGRLDATFGEGGVTYVSLPGGGRTLHAAVVQPDGRIVVAGGADGDARFALARLEPDGSVDRSFGVDGAATAPFSAPYHQGAATDLIRDPEGNLVAAGEVTTDEERSRRRFVVARFTSDGDPDPSFGGDGTVMTAFGSSSWEEGVANALARQADGRLVVTGWTYTPPRGTGPAVARYLPDGSLDPSFDGDGRVTNPPAGDDVCDTEIPEDVVVGNGTISIVANRRRGPVTRWITVARYRDDGSLDPGFAGDGVAQIPIEDVTRGRARGSGCGDPPGPPPATGEGNALTLDPDGSVTVAGWSFPGGYGPRAAFLLVRLRPDGAFDDGFGDAGQVRTSFGSCSAHAEDLLISGTRLIVAGDVPGPGYDPGRIAMAAYQHTGVAAAGTRTRGTDPGYGCSPPESQTNPSTGGSPATGSSPTDTATGRAPLAVTDLTARGTARRRGRVTVTGRLLKPEGEPTPCAGVVSAELWRGSRQVARGATELGSCRYRITLRVTGARLRGARRLRLRARFHGGPGLAPDRAPTRSVRLPR